MPRKQFMKDFKVRTNALKTNRKSITWLPGSASREQMCTETITFKVFSRLPESKQIRISRQVNSSEIWQFKFACNPCLFLRFWCSGKSLNGEFGMFSLVLVMFDRRRQIVLRKYICARYICDWCCFIFLMFFDGSSVGRAEL